MEIRNFQQSTQIAGSAAVDMGDGILQINLAGEVGADKPISLASVSRKLALRDFRHLHIEIATTGGCSREAFLIYDFLRAQPVPVSMRAVGPCLSAGVVIFMAGDLRSASADAEFLLHPASLARGVLPASITASALREHAERLSSIDARLVDLFARRTGWYPDWFAAEQETEEPLSVCDAINTGLVHEFDGYTVKIDATWPERASLEASSRGVYLPPHLFTQNYYSACRCAGSLHAHTKAAVN